MSPSLCLSLTMRPPNSIKTPSWVVQNITCCYHTILFMVITVVLTTDGYTSPLLKLTC